MSQSNRLLLVFLLMLVVPASAALAQMDIYLYNEEVVENVNIGAFLETGEVELLLGSGEGSMKYVLRAPAPDPYPNVHMWEQDIERLGANCFEIDGIQFINHGTQWVKNRQALVLWEIQIPNASQRQPFEFEKDLTLSLWADWNGDEMWAKNETMIREHINLHSYMPTVEDVVRVYYLTSFRVPDVDDIVGGANNDPDNAENDKDVVNIWVRGIVSYDDPDVSPDGEQIFGEVEDYRAKYMKTPRGIAK